MKKVILITGASSGFGKETAKELLKQNWTVYATSRRLEKMEDLKQLGAETRSVDVTKDEQVNGIVEEIIEKEGQIDAVLANAGYGEYGTIEDIPMEDIKYQYDVNVFGVLRTVKAVLPYMREKRNGNIVITASLASHVSGMGLGHYSATKHALNAIGDALRQETDHLGINVSLIEPGLVKTGFGNVMLEKFDTNKFSPDYRKKMEIFKKFNADGFANAPEMNNTIRDIVHAITSDRPRAIYKTTFQSKYLSLTERLFPPKLLDKITGMIMKG